MRVIPPVEFSDTLGTFTRASIATYIDKTGAMAQVSSGVPRFTYNPTTLLPLGVVIEAAATNLLLNSLLNGTALSTQSVSVTAQAYTLSFYGTGSVTLSGTATGTLAGTGVFPARVSLTFTPTAGSLTLTVTGSVQYANLEAGSAATTFIPTAGTSVTRAADVVSGTAPCVVYSDVPESETPWDSGTSYAIGDIALIAATHTLYQARTANTNKPPAANPSDWADIGPSNQWAMIDRETNSQTSQSTQIRVLLMPGGVDSIALTGLEGTKLDVAQVVSGANTYSSQKSLDGSIVLDDYMYFFEPFDFLTQSVSLDVPNYSTGLISVEITGTTAKCGAVVCGQQFELGGLLYGATSRVRDYSIVTRDEFGAATLVRRKTVPTVEGQVSVDKERSRAVRARLRDLAGTPAMFVGIDDDDDQYYELVTLLGILVDWGIQIEYTDAVVLGFEIEEL